MLAFYLSLVDSPEDQEKVMMIYNEFYTFMAFIIKKYVKNESDIEDIIHDCMLRIIECIDRLDFSIHERTKKFCAIIARNRAIDFCRRKENQKIIFDETYYIDEHKTLSPHDIVMHNEIYKIVYEEINNLNEKYRDVCLFKFIYTLKDKEIATLLGLSVELVSMRASRGRKMLRESLKKEGIYERV